MKKSSRASIVAIGVLTVTVFATVARAGTIGPKKPSATATTTDTPPVSTTACPIPSVELTLPTIPNGKVLVVTAYAWGAVVSIPGPSFLDTALAINDGVTTTKRYTTSAITNGQGNAVTQVAVPSGIVVKPTDHVCLVPVNTTNAGYTAASVSGFINTDN